MNLTFNVPINPVSFGVTSICILREIFNRKKTVKGVFPIGSVDVSAQKPDAEFSAWLQNSINTSVLNHAKNTSVLRLWHVLQSMESVVSTNNALFTFHETSDITDVEKHILNQQDKIFVSSPYTKEVFESGGVTTPVVLCPLGFDSFNLFKTNKKYYQDGRIVFGLNGKAENRKGTYRILNLWAKKFGNDKRYVLHCLINNPFIGQITGNPNLERQLINQALEGKNYWNINFVPYCKTNAELNDVLNVQDINLDGLSLCEGFNYGLFNSLCLGKQSIVLNAHVHKLYANDKNSILVEPRGMIDAEDQLFFKKGNIINIGEWFNWDENEVSGAMDLAIGRAKVLNSEGEKLKDLFSFSKTLDIITQNMNN